MHAYKVQTKDQILLHVHQWNNDKKPKGTICIIHGLGEHQGRYEHIAKFYVENGFQVYSYDQRGHGKSEGKRGHSPGLNHNLDDLERVIKTIPHHHLFLYGHSFGGNVLANFLLRKQPTYLKGAILSAPWIILAKKPNLLKIALAKIMNKIYPDFTLNKKLDTDNLSHDEATCQTYFEDPLNHDRISARLFTDFSRSGLWALKNAEKLPIRVLLIHGMNDEIVSSIGTIKFTENSKGLAECKLFENTKHEVHNDLTQGELFDYTLNWLKSRLS